MNAIAYFNGGFLAKSEVRVSPDDRGFLFSDGVYEVVRSYGGRLFELDAHLDRLAASLAALRIEGVDVRGLSPVCSELLVRNGLGASDALVYLQVTRGAAPRSHRFPQPPAEPTAYGVAWPFEAAAEEGATAITLPDQRWTRCDIKTIALVPNCLAAQRAHEAAAEEAIFVRDGIALEGTHTNLFAVFRGAVRTPPLTNYILAGITRRVVLELCRSEGVDVQERPILVDELLSADEVFLSGTTTEITPILAVDGRTVGSGRPGPIALRLLGALRARTRD